MYINIVVGDGLVPLQVQHWTGLISAAVLIVDATRDVHAVEEWWLTTPGAMLCVDLHLVCVRESVCVSHCVCGRERER